MPDVDQQALPTSNGHAATLHHDDQIVALIRVQADALEAKRAELQAALDEITPQLKRYEKALLAIQGEPLRKDRRDPETGELIPRAKPGPKPKGTVKVTGASAESIARNEAAIRQLAEDHEDITQVEVRAITGESSGASSLAFRALRERGTIRLARQDGNAKYFRLTRSAINNEPPTLDDLQNERAEDVTPSDTITKSRTARGVGVQTLREIEQTFRRLADEGDGEVRQADVTEALPISNSTVSLAFKMLVERDVIQWARDSGIDRYFVLVGGDA